MSTEMKGMESTATQSKWNASPILNLNILKQMLFLYGLEEYNLKNLPS